MPSHKQRYQKKKALKREQALNELVVKLLTKNPSLSAEKAITQAKLILSGKTPNTRKRITGGTQTAKANTMSLKVANALRDAQ